MDKQLLIQKYSYYTDFVVVPFMIIASLVFGGFSMLLFILGLSLWTIIEYFMHSYVFHRLYRKEHWKHHIYPDTHIPAWKTSIIVLLLFVFAMVTNLTSVYIGLAAGYWFYMVIHDAIHHKNFITKYIPNLKAGHDIHHEKGIEANFGVITFFWDRVFGTFKK